MLCLEEHSYLVFFNDTATTEIYTLSLHDALPISGDRPGSVGRERGWRRCWSPLLHRAGRPPDQGRRPYSVAHCADRKSTRLNSSHANISYAVFCLQKNLFLPSLLIPITLFHFTYS